MNLSCFEKMPMVYPDDWSVLFKDDVASKLASEN